MYSEVTATKVGFRHGIFRKGNSISEIRRDNPWEIESFSMITSNITVFATKKEKDILL